MNKLQAAQKKAEWLTYCLSIGFEKSQLDTLSAIWDQFKDEYGNLRPAEPPPLPAESGEQELKRLQTLINNPEIENFLEGVRLEAAHQLERWGIENEESNPPHHYILVSTKLLGKLSVAIWDKDIEKFKHHCITLAAELFNCHRQIKKEGTIIHDYFHGKLNSPHNQKEEVK